MKIGPDGLIVEADEEVARLHAESLTNASRLAERFDSPLLALSQELTLAVEHADFVVRSFGPLKVKRRITEIEVLLLASFGLDLASQLRSSPPSGLSVIHVGAPDTEWLVWTIPDGSDNATAICFEILRLVDPLQDLAARSRDDQNATTMFEAGQFGHRHCDWCDRDVSATHSVWDMRVLLMGRGNRLFAWVCCSTCGLELEGQYPGGLCWIPSPPTPLGTRSWVFASV
ncbi:hypothetical protein [Williamsia phyllosphaerae]|uniref:Uncharacterized protein n=1 Tax=Williamsia phyllosphaerae TaxID=885042 RepID=A0ABQ1UAB8_9NOCA|nr:hypothetical protein [Williamsia phyllosphaerae]GGF13050.1 hypothetical protein GCM10007298_06240 [Williamsia phyllosphaerae]